MDPSEKLSNLREVNGRIFNTTNERYILPADGVEHRRLDSQHQAVITMLGDLFPKGSGAAEILARSFEGYKPRVLDLGTGSGAWAIDVALKYPNVEVLGLDLAPVNPGLPPPPNCRFEQGDATMGLKQYGRFDVVHARAILQGVKDFAALFGEVAEVLNPQGVFVSIEAETCLYDKNKIKHGPQKEGDPDFSWTQELAMAYLEATTKRNPNFPNLSNVSDILKEDSGERWETIERTDFLLPCGPCEGEGERERVAGKLMHQSVLKVPKGLQVLFLSSGYAADYVNRLTEMASEEIVSCRVMNWMKWFVVWAVKSRRPAEFGFEVDVEPE